MEDTQTAIDKLAALASPLEWLREHDYKGVAMDPCHCPVAKYLKAKTGDDHTVTPIAILNMKTKQFYGVPLNVAEVIHDVDTGQAPELTL